MRRGRAYVLKQWQGRAALAGGPLGESYEKVRRNFYTGIDPRRHAETYAGMHPDSYAEPEFTGKYLDLCAYFYTRDKDARALENGMRVVRSIAENQRADGYLGCLAAGRELRAFSIWNHGFTLYGLTRMYEATGDAAILALAEKAGDWLAELFLQENAPEILDAGNQGSQHISCLYFMGRLYAVTKKPRYAEFLHFVMRHCEQTAMNLLSFGDILSLMSQKGIEMLVVYLGVLQYGLLFDRPEAVAAARRYWRQVRDTQIRNTGNGTIREVWTKDGNAPRLMPTEEKPNETCVAAGWMELSLALFAQEPRACYLDALEQTLFNHLLGSLEKNGADLAYYQGNWGRKIYRTGEGMYQCCRYRGYTLFSYLPEYLYAYDGETLIPLLYAPSEFTAEGLRARQETEYPRVGSVRLCVENAGGEKRLLLRIPGWCESWRLFVNGRLCASAPQAGFLALPLPPGKTNVLFEMDTPLRSQRHSIQGRPYASFQYGPLLLARDTHDGGTLWRPLRPDTPFERRPAADTLARFEGPGETLVDFASAGGRDPERDEYAVFIPLLESEPR